MGKINSLFLVLAASLSLSRFLASSTATGIASSPPPRWFGNTSALDVDSTNTVGLLPRDQSYGLDYKSCSSITTCGNCTNTYSCHWCKKTEDCHARGSIHGCAWGDTCSKDEPKEKNHTCASQPTCSECSKSSHFCHWCEHDNACHAVGSRFGCSYGVDCYSNDRCRRSEAEPLPVPSSKMQSLIAVVEIVPVTSLIAILCFAIGSIWCLCSCHRCASNLECAPDGLAVITETARVAPMGGPSDVQYALLDDPPEEEIAEEAIQSNNDCDVNNDDNDNNNGDSLCDGGAASVEQPSQISQQSDVPNVAQKQINNDQQEQHQQQQQPIEEGVNSAHSTENNNIDRETGPLLHPSFSRTIVEVDEYRCVKLSYRIFYTLYCISIFLVVAVVGIAIFFYPQMPEHNVCNDEVAWTGIMKNIVAFRFDASFEILATLSNPNRIGVALDKANGSFSFEGQQFGTFQIPPLTAKPVAITDFMIILHISPASNAQAVRLVEAYYMGKLVLEAEFEGVVRVPTLFNYTREFGVNNTIVDINGASDRSLCRCPKWEDGEKESSNSLLQSMEDQWSLSFHSNLES